MEEKRRHISILEKLFGEMSPKQRTRMQRKFGWACVWVMACFGVALVVEDEMIAKTWRFVSQWIVGLF